MFLNGSALASFSFLFYLFMVQYRKFVASRIQTLIVRVEGESADHYNTTMAQIVLKVKIGSLFIPVTLNKISLVFFQMDHNYKWESALMFGYAL